MASSPPVDAAAERYRRYVGKTMLERIPAILRIAEEGLDRIAVENLKAIGRAVAANAPMVMELGDWPYVGWEDLPRRINGKRIADAPFFDFEYWLYFRILSGTRFLKSRVDPFRAIKHKDMDAHLAWAEEALAKITSFPDALRLSLDANADDLSQTSAPKTRLEFGREQLEIDPSRLRRLNIVADNFGIEFLADLILAVTAAEAGLETHIHVKQLPMFVSDVTVEDVTILLDRLGPPSKLSQRLASAVRVQMIRVNSNSIWSAPKFLDGVPAEELGVGEGILTVLKGDLNYRRAIGDVSVDIGTPFGALPVLPAASMLSLRSIKSYCVAGVDRWPTGLSRVDFPMDGSIVAVQRIPARGSGAPMQPAPVPADGLSRMRRLVRRPAGPN
ncbi:MAG: ARMT1-like domain-containing protein [Devosia sp.]